MKKLHIRKNKIIAGFLLFIVFAIAFSLFLRFYIRRQYLKLVNNQEITAAFIDGDTVKINEISNKYKLDYQLVGSGKILKSTNQALPKYRLIAVKNKVYPGILVAETADLLSEQQPYTDVIGGRLYIIVPIFDSENSNDGYLLYSKIIL